MMSRRSLWGRLIINGSPYGHRKLIMRLTGDRNVEIPTSSCLCLHGSSRLDGGCLVGLVTR